SGRWPEITYFHSPVSASFWRSMIVPVKMALSTSNTDKSSASGSSSAWVVITYWPLRTSSRIRLRIRANTSALYGQPSELATRDSGDLASDSAFQPSRWSSDSCEARFGLQTRVRLRLSVQSLHQTTTSSELKWLKFDCRT